MLVPPLNREFVLVIGATSPTGSTVTKLLLSAGARIIATDKCQADIDRLYRELGDSPCVLPYQLDMGSSESVSTFEANMRGIFGDEGDGYSHVMAVVDERGIQRWDTRFETAFSNLKTKEGGPSITFIQPSPLGQNTTLPAAIYEWIANRSARAPGGGIRLHHLWTKPASKPLQAGTLPLTTRMARAAVASISLFPDADQRLVFCTSST